jgi:hypothetical protein
MAHAIATITMGDKEQIATGSFQTLGMEIDTKVHLTWLGDDILLIFHFEEDGTDDPAKNKGEALDNGTLRITFKNYKSLLPIYPLQPLKIGTLATREMFLVYAIQKIPGTARHLVEFSLLAGQEVANG